MAFPESSRVIYRKNPLVEVICQLRFPAILRIDTEVPAQYQEKLRETYPIFGDSQTSEVKLNLAPDLANLVGSSGPISLRGGKASYEFISGDQSWKVSMDRESLALSTVKYERWEVFKEKLIHALESFVQLYSPLFYSRIGLRYRDVIQRSNLGLSEAPWSALLKPHIAGELSSEIAHDIVHSANQVTIRLDGRGQVLINHGLAFNQEKEVCYLIDSDFSTDQRTELNDAIKILDFFNEQSARLFRWCITERLNEAMEPLPI
ncbi:MAG TPA: TIGR04255 family protein [Blastocatellia bacterium]|nr:TIGR04255 family protein [Blastocatellia bacterium]